MCGIGCVWFREGVMDWNLLDIFFKGLEQRGKDGFGIAIVRNGEIETVKRWVNSYSEIKCEVRELLESEQLEIGDLIIAIARAQPETEVDTSFQNMQPIAKNNIVLVHNGSVSEECREKYSHLGYLTEIDSEAIINAYITNGYNMRRTMEDLVGGFAVIMYDQSKNRLYCINDFKPLAVGYFRGYGFVAHSSFSVFEDLSVKIVGSSRTGMNVWEDYYFHWQEGYTIREIDLDSGMQRIYNFTPKFKHPTWDSREDNGKELALVICSGGIDSSLTAYILKLAGYEVKLIHFLYGQKGEEAENLAVKRLAEWMGADVYWVDLREFYRMIDDPSMLLKEEIQVTTGTSEDIKSTVAWVSARNLIFIAKTLAIAESEILRNNWRKVYIAGGFANLSEEGFYPDNSEYFFMKAMELAKFGCITGSRIEWLPVFKNIMKYEEWILGSALGFRFDLTVSCDQPKVKDGEIYLCGECGSDYLSHVASLMAGVKDPRKFEKKAWKIPIRCKEVKRTSPERIIERLILPEDRKQRLISYLTR